MKYLLVLLAFSANAQTTVYTNQYGQTTGYSSTNGNVTTYSNQYGQPVGTSINPPPTVPVAPPVVVPPPFPLIQIAPIK